jgi:hypothetical protein
VLVFANLILTVLVVFVCSRQNPMGLLVALDPGSGKLTKGNLFWDDGESFG